VHAFLDRLEAVFTWVAVAVTAGTMALTTADAMGRYLFAQPITGVFEITTDYLMVALVFLAASYAYRTGSFVRVTILLEHAPARVRLTADYVAQIVSALVGVALVVAAARQARRTLMSGTMSVSLISYPLGPAHVLATLGLLLMALRIIADLSRVSTGQSGMLREDSEAV